MKTIYYIQMEKLLITRSLLLIKYYISFLMNLIIIFFIYIYITYFCKYVTIN